MRERGINQFLEKAPLQFNDEVDMEESALQMCPSRSLLLVLNPTAVTQTEENSLRVENNSCRDQ